MNLRSEIAFFMVVMTYLLLCLGNVLIWKFDDGIFMNLAMLGSGLVWLFIYKLANRKRDD
jgi:hypothetical protein